MGHAIFLLLQLLALVLFTSACHAQAAIAEEVMKEGGVESMMRAMVGSRPPSCEGRCRSCGRCEAVQVPVTPQVELQKKRSRRRSSSSSSSLPAGARGGGSSRRRGGGASSLLPSSYDDHSNYKPLSWRCKCGGMLLNP